MCGDVGACAVGLPALLLQHLSVLIFGTCITRVTMNEEAWLLM